MPRAVLPIEILIKGKPYKMVDVPIIPQHEQITKQEIIEAERRAFWAIVSQREYEPEEVTARYAPRYAAEG
jgi:hypothetical protein